MWLRLLAVSGVQLVVGSFVVVTKILLSNTHVTNHVAIEDSSVSQALAQQEMGSADERVSVEEEKNLQTKS